MSGVTPVKASADNGSLYSTRWAEGRAYIRLCTASLREGEYVAAIEWLHQAHNLGRDNVALHVLTHLQYVRFSLHEGDYRRAMGHLFWALSSPVLVPLGRRKRTEIVGDWKPAPRTISDGVQPVSLPESAIVALPRSDGAPEIPATSAVALEVITLPVDDTPLPATQRITD